MNTRQYQHDPSKQVRNSSITPNNTVKLDMISRNASLEKTPLRSTSISNNKSGNISPISKQINENPLNRTISTFNMTSKNDSNKHNYIKKTISRGIEENSSTKISNQHNHSNNKYQSSVMGSSNKTPNDVNNLNHNYMNSSYQTSFNNYNQSIGTNNSQQYYNKQSNMSFNDNSQQNNTRPFHITYSEQKPSLSTNIQHNYEARNLSPYTKQVVTSHANSYIRSSQSPYTMQTKLNHNNLNVTEQTNVRKSIDITHSIQNQSLNTSNQRTSLTQNNISNMQARNTIDETIYKYNEDHITSSKNIPREKPRNTQETYLANDNHKKSYENVLPDEKLRNTVDTLIQNERVSHKQDALQNERMSHKHDVSYNPLLTRISHTRHDDSMSRSVSRSPQPNRKYTNQMYYKLVNLNNHMASPAPDVDKQKSHDKSVSPRKNFDIDNYSHTSKEFLRNLTPAKSRDASKENSLHNKSLFSNHMAKSNEVSPNTKSSMIRESQYSQTKKTRNSTETFNLNVIDSSSSQKKSPSSQNEINKFYPIIKRANEVWNIYIKALQQLEGFEKNKNALDNQLHNLKKENSDLSNYLVSNDLHSKEPVTTTSINHNSIKTVLNELEAQLIKINDVFNEDKSDINGMLYNDMKSIKLEFYKEAQEVKKIKENLLVTLDFQSLIQKKKKSNEIVNIDKEIEELIKDNIYYCKKNKILKEKNKSLIKEVDRLQDQANNYANKNHFDMKNDISIISLNKAMDSKNNTFAEVISFEDKKLRTLEETIKNLSETNVHLQTEQEALKKQKNYIQQEKEELIKNNTNFTENQQNMTKNCEGLQEENKQLRESKNEIKNAPAINSSSQDTEKISDQLQALAKQKKYNLEFEKEKHALKESYDTVKTENENLHSKIGNLEGSKKDLIEHLEKITKDFSQTQHERDMLLNNTQQNAENDELREKLHSYTNELDMMHNNYYGLEKHMQAALETKGKLETDVLNLNNENLLLKRDFEKRIHEVHNQCDSVAQDNVKLEEANRKLIANNRDLNERLEHLIEDKKYLEKDKESYSKENEVINSEINSMKDALVKFKDDYNQEKGKYKDYYTQLENDNRNLKRVIEKINVENENLIQNNVKLIADKEVLSAKSLANLVEADFTTERFMNIQSIRPDSQEMYKMKIENETKERQIENMSNQHTDQLLRYEKLIGDYDGICSKYEKSKSENHELNTIYGVYKDDQENLLTKYEKLQSSRFYSEKRLVTENNDLVGMYDQSKNEFNDILIKYEKLNVDHEILQGKYEKLLNEHYYLEGKVISNKEDFEYKYDNLEIQRKTLEKELENARSITLNAKSRDNNNTEKRTVSEINLAEISFDNSQLENNMNKSIPCQHTDNIYDEDVKYLSRSPTAKNKKNFEFGSDANHKNIHKPKLENEPKNYTSMVDFNEPKKDERKTYSSSNFVNVEQENKQRSKSPTNIPKPNNEKKNLVIDIEKKESMEDLKKDQFSEKIETLEDKVNSLCKALKKTQDEIPITPMEKAVSPTRVSPGRKSVQKKKSVDNTKGVKFKLDNNFLACDSTNSISVYKTSKDASDNNLVYELEKMPDFKKAVKKPIHAFALNSNNKYLYAGLDSGHVVEWDLSSKGKIRRVLPKINDHKITNLVINQDDTVLFGTDFNGNLIQWFISEDITKNQVKKQNQSNIEDSISDNIPAMLMINSDREAKHLILPALCGLVITKNNKYLFALNKRGVLMQFTRTVSDSNEIKYKQTFLARSKNLLGNKVDFLLASNDSSHIFVLSKESNDLVQIPIGDDDKGIASNYEDRWSYKDMLVKNKVFRIDFMLITNDSQYIQLSDNEANLTQISISKKKMIKTYGKIFEQNISCIGQSYFTKDGTNECIFFGDTAGQVIKYDYMAHKLTVLPLSDPDNPKPLYSKNLKIQEIIVSSDNQYLYVTYSNKSNMMSITQYDIKKNEFIRNYDFSDKDNVTKSITCVLNLGPLSN